jgi:hypothetical protein
VLVPLRQIVAHQDKKLCQLRSLRVVQRAEEVVFNLVLRGCCGSQTLLSLLSQLNQVAAAIARITLACHKSVGFQGIELGDEHAGRNVGPTVVHVSSNAARYPQPNGAPYAAAKAALNAYSKSLALACGPHGVRVTSVMPGVIETDAVEASLRNALERTGRDLNIIRKGFNQRLAALSAVQDSPKRPPNSSPFSPRRAPPTSLASPSPSTEDSFPPSENPCPDRYFAAGVRKPGHAARDGGDAVVRGETGDQTDQESRSAGHRAATSLTASRSSSSSTRHTGSM